jgi:hypothetical protein
MPFAKWKNFDDCLSDVARRQSYSDEVAHKVCGKLKAQFEKADVDEDEMEKAIQSAAEEYMNSKPSPSKDDLREVKQNIQKGWEFNPKDILASQRIVEGTFHVPKVDKDKELITKSAMMSAIPDFMHLPILHDFHRERVLGLIVKAWEEGDHFKFRALFKATSDVDDAWEKVQKGEYDHVSIYGSRLEGTHSCKFDPSTREDTCISHRIRLDSISACDDNARNSDAIMSIAKSSTRFCNDLTDTFIKAETTSSSLMHGTQDGVNKPMDKCNKLEKGEEGLLKKIWETLQKLVESDKKVHASIEKAEETKMVDEVKKAETPVKEEVEVVKAEVKEESKVEPKIEEVKKAEPAPSVDEIVKAKTEEITKAFQTQIAELKAEIEKLKEEPIQKAAPILIKEQVGEPYGSSNYRAIAELKRG